VVAHRHKLYVPQPPTSTSSNINLSDAQFAAELFNMLGFTASRTQICAYLFGVALFSISFLVFLNSSISFVITQRIGQGHRVGDAVGTLGFTDELVALFACPAWGLLSDRIGVRNVAVLGYVIVGVSLCVFVQAKNVYPQLLLARIFFSLGATAT
jgi:MFS family permease